MSFSRIRQEDFAGLALALLAHGGLIAALVLMPKPAPPPKVERVTVTLSDEVGLQAGSPSVEEARTAEAPVLAEQPAQAPAPAAAPIPLPRPEPKVAPPPPRPVPQPVQKRPMPPAPQVQKRMPPAPTPVAARPQPPRQRIGDNFLPPAPNQGKKPGGGSKIGADFLPGSVGNGKAKTPPGPAVTPLIRASLEGAIAREIRPFFQGRVPQGVDTDKLVTILAWDLNADGNLAGDPRLIRQEGVTDSNKQQAKRHYEEAMRSVRLASPFSLPSQYYSAWKKVSAFRFDRKLSQ